MLYMLLKILKNFGLDPSPFLRPNLPKIQRTLSEKNDNITDLTLIIITKVFSYAYRDIPATAEALRAILGIRQNCKLPIL